MPALPLTQDQSSKTLLQKRNKPPIHSQIANVDSALETKNTWHRPDPSFTYLLSFFLLLTALAWGLAYAPAFASIVKLSLIFVCVHFLLGSLLVSTAAYFLVGRLLGPGIAGLPGRRRQQGLFTQPGGADQLEFGYCFDVRSTGPHRCPLWPGPCGHFVLI